MIILFPALITGCLFEREATIEDFSITVQEDDCVVEVEFDTDDPFYLRLEGPRGILATHHVQDPTKSEASISFFTVREGRYLIRAMEREDGGSIDSMAKNYEGPELDPIDQDISYDEPNDKVRFHLNRVQIRNSGDLPLEVSSLEVTLNFDGEQKRGRLHKDRYFIASEQTRWVSIELSFDDLPPDTECEVNVIFTPGYQEDRAFNFTTTTPG